MVVRGYRSRKETEKGVRGGDAWALQAMGMVLALCLCGLLLTSMRTEAMWEALDEAPTKVVHVCAGETLWHIAEGLDWSSTRTDLVVRWIRARNGLASACLRVGDELVVPVCQASMTEEA